MTIKGYLYKKYVSETFAMLLKKCMLNCSVTGKHLKNEEHEKS